MAHEYASHRNSETKRVGHLLKSGGVAHSDAAADKKLITKMLKEHEKSEGEKHGGVVTKGRLDRSYAKGGRTKGHKKPHVQVNIISKSDPNNMPPPVVGLAGGPPAAAPGGPLPVGAKGVAPGLAPPPVAAGPVAAAPPPPPMKRGGRAKRPMGGRIPIIRTMRAPMSPMHPMRGLPMVGKKGFKSGGSIPGEPTKANLAKWSARAEKNSPVAKRAAGGRLTGGAETGVGRLEKAARYRRGR